MKYKTEPRELIYTYISGKGAPKFGVEYTNEDPSKFDFKASQVLTAEEAKPVQKIIKDFWAENKDKYSGKKLSGTFLSEEMKVTEDKDEYGEPIKMATGNYVLTASTNAAFKNNKGEINLNSIGIYTSKGVKLAAPHPLVVGEVGVGEGSQGIIHGEIAVTTFESKAYVKLYLKGVQFTKFVARELAGVDAEELDVEDDGLGGDGLDVTDASGEGPNL